MPDPAFPLQEHETFIVFRPGPASPSGKTQTWHVETKAGLPLGEVKWYAPWRCYSFFQREETVYERKCLRDIADFCERETQARRRNV